MSSEDENRNKDKKETFFSKVWRKFNVKNWRVSFEQGMKSLEANGRSLFVAVFAAIVVMVLVCLTVFFATVRAPEKVLIPQTEGKELTQALLEMQVKELYPKIQLRYDERPAGTILAQSPKAGSIVKAGTRVSLTVSRGAVVTEVGNYVGENYDKVKIDLTTMFTGSSRPLIVLAEPVYRPDLSDAGTILEQNPPEGTPISEPVTVSLIVSRGPNYDNTRVPNYVGRSFSDMISILPNSKLVIDFNARRPKENEKELVVVSQQKVDREFLPNYSRISVDITLPEKTDGDVCGIFETTLADYPYPVSMSLECLEENGHQYEILSLKHIGGRFTVPYKVPENSELILKVAGKIVHRCPAN